MDKTRQTQSPAHSRRGLASAAWTDEARTGSEEATYAAVILRLLEGGWPWLLTKRICLGGGMVAVMRVVIADVLSWQVPW